LTGVTRLLENFQGSGSLIILNYHRIGNARQTPYDSGLFSCTSEELSWQVEWLKRRFSIVTLDQALEIVHGESTPERNSVLLTFDDGYRDNYDQAFLALRKQQVSGTFFLPTAFVGTGLLPWWDQIAFIVKGSKKSRIILSYPEPRALTITGQHRARSIRSILDLFKSPKTTNAELFISELAKACGSKRVTDERHRCFLTWDEAREMQRDGMCFGSHTHSHEILSKLPYERQVEELEASKAILDRELGGSTETLAYPVGSPDTFSADTFRALRTARYRTAFSFYSGVNQPGHIQPFNVLRASVTHESRASFRLRIALLAATARKAS
jgi:peptidoglycan/xylan/chitin deacetylase (PgdA/CDA1 family)